MFTYFYIEIISVQPKWDHISDKKYRLCRNIYIKIPVVKYCICDYTGLLLSHFLPNIFYVHLPYPFCLNSSKERIRYHLRVSVISYSSNLFFPFCLQIQDQELYHIDQNARYFIRSSSSCYLFYTKDTLNVEFLLRYVRC